LPRAAPTARSRQGRWRIHHDDVKTIRDAFNPLLQAIEKGAIALRHPRCEFIFGIEQTKVGRDQLQAVEMGFAERVVEGRSLALAKERVKGIIFGEIKIGDVAEKRGCRRLAVTINQRDAVSSNGKILGQMDRHSGLANAALEVLNRDDAAGIIRVR
jgi:hypothetical protein